MKEVENILRILKSASQMIESDKTLGLKDLSDQTIHSATISQDPDNIIVAVLVYALSKSFNRDYYRKMEGWKTFEDSVKKNLKSAYFALESNDVDRCRVGLGKIRNSINKINGNLSNYIRSIFEKAKINKAFRMYEHGLSSEQTAELLGISLWDLATYIGQDSSAESRHPISMPIKKRIKLAEDFFN